MFTTAKFAVVFAQCRCVVLFPIDAVVTGHFAYWTVRLLFGHFAHRTLRLQDISPTGQFAYWTVCSLKLESSSQQF